MKPFTVRKQFATRESTGGGGASEKADPVEEGIAALARLSALIDAPPGEVTDEIASPYWITVVFQTRAQKEEFLRAVGLLRFADWFFQMSWAAPHLLGAAPSAATIRSWAVRATTAPTTPDVSPVATKPRTGFLGRADAERERMAACIDATYWISLTFMSPAKRDAFVAQWEAKWNASMGLDADWCCNGLAVAEAMAIVLVSPTPDWNGMGKRTNKRMRSFVTKR